MHGMIEVEDARPRDTPKKTWREVVDPTTKQGECYGPQ